MKATYSIPVHSTEARFIWDTNIMHVATRINKEATEVYIPEESNKYNTYVEGRQGVSPNKVASTLQLQHT